MSFQAVNAVFECSQATGSKRVLLLAIASFSRDIAPPFTAWPSQTKLAHYSRISLRRAKELIAELVDSGELDIAEHGGGYGNTNLYRINLETVRKLAPLRPRKRCENQTSSAPAISHRFTETNGRPALGSTQTDDSSAPEASPFLG